MFLMCLVLYLIIFRNPHAQNAWVTQKSSAIVLQSRPTSRYVRPISSPQRIEFTWNLREIVMGPPFEAPKMRFLTAFRSDWSSKREIFRPVEFNKFQSLIFKVAGQKNSRKIVLDPEGKYLTKSGLSLCISPYPETGCITLYNSGFIQIA